MKLSASSFSGIPLHLEPKAAADFLDALNGPPKKQADPKNYDDDDDDGDGGGSWMDRALAHLKMRYDPATGIATMPVIGMMWKGLAKWEEWLFDAYNTDRIFENLAAARLLPGIKGLEIVIDSPGGMARGCDELAAAMVAFSAETGIETQSWIGNMGCSAAYYLASGSNGIHASPSALVGSIGTMAVAVDSSRLFKERGVDMKLYTGGADLKGMGSTGIHWSKAWHDKLDGDVKQLRGEFVGFVKSRRPDITEDSFRGDAFEAKRAPAGMVDTARFRSYGEFHAAFSTLLNGQA